MNFFFDNNLPPALAQAVRALCVRENDVHSVIHLSERFDRDVADLVWIPVLGEDVGPWYVVSIDKFKKDKRAERIAITRAGLTVYVLDAQWSKHRFWDQAARLIVWWPALLAHARLSSGGVFRVPWKHTGQSRFQAV